MTRRPLRLCAGGAAILWIAAACYADPGPVDASAAPALSISPAPAASIRLPVDPLVAQGNKKYYDGELTNAVAAYQKAVEQTPELLDGWLNGAIVLGELGKTSQEIRWLRQAAALSPRDPKIATELGWAQFHGRQFKQADAQFQAALALDPKAIYAQIGLGRAELAEKMPDKAAADLVRAEDLDPQNDLAHYYEGQALEARGDSAGAVAAYKKAAINDNYFVEDRYAMGRAYMKRSRFYDAALQFAKVLDADPANILLKQLREKMRRLIPTGLPPEDNGKKSSKGFDSGVEMLSRQAGNVPILRVGIGTTAMGRPIPRWALQFEASTSFSIVNAKTNKTIASGGAREAWSVRFSAAKKKWRFEILNPQGEIAAASRSTIILRPDHNRGGTLLLQDIPYGGGTHWAGIGTKHLRGDIELSLHPSGKGFKIVNIVDLESYTHGLLSAEMPIGSPLEALKAQAVIARTNALYIKTVLHRHAKDGYDICDGQHCQVYSGISAESERSRAVVDATRARIVAYKGKVAQALYSSNCGGHTQGGAEINGWGDTPYWKGIQDAPEGSPAYPESPWALHWWLRENPPAYCMGSSYVYPSHYRWIRVVPAKLLSDKLNRTSNVGRILSIRTLRRAKSGHLNSILVHGSRKDLKITHEINIRNLLGLGSQRSALFVLDTEPGADGRPETFIFHGAGWGHGVGLCQSGAMGRAERGQTYAEILKAYYQGTELGNLLY